MIWCPYKRAVNNCTRERAGGDLLPWVLAEHLTSLDALLMGVDSPGWHRWVTNNLETISARIVDEHRKCLGALTPDYQIDA